MNTIGLILRALLLTTVVASAESRSADEIMSKAEAAASVEHKALFVHFDASWCAYCKRLEAWLESQNVKPIFQTYFVTLKLVLMENETNKALENPGAGEWFLRLGGPDALPFHAFTDARGALIVNCRPPDPWRSREEYWISGPSGGGRMVPEDDPEGCAQDIPG